MKSSVLFTLAGTVCCLAGVTSAQVGPTSPAGQPKPLPSSVSTGKALPAKKATMPATGAKSTTGHTEGVSFVDNCGDAPTVGEGTYSYDLNGATNDYTGTCGATETAQDMWVRYVPSGDGNATFSTCGLTGADSVLSVVDGCGGPSLACSDDFCAAQSQVTVGVLAGHAYYVRVADFAGGVHAGSVAITLAAPCHPTRPAGAIDENEACQSDLATDTNGGCNIPSGGVQSINLGDSVWGTASTYINPADGGAYRDTDWYEVSASGGNSVTVTGNAAFPLRLFILDTNCPPALLATAASTGQCAEVSVTGLASGTFRVFAGPDVFEGIPCDGGTDNHYWITVTGVPVVGPDNDNCDQATAVTDGTYDFDNSLATTDGSSSCGFNTGADVWFKYHATADGQVQASTCGLTGVDTVLTAFDGCGGNEVACLDDFCGFQTQLRAPVTAGSDVYFRVAGYDNSRGSGQIEFSFIVPCHPERPAGAIDENEGCQSDSQTDNNGGCNIPSGAVQNITAGQSVWGTASTFIDPGTGLQYRDTDWYEVANDSCADVTVTGNAAFPLRIFILDANCPPALIGTAASTGDCNEVSVSARVGRGAFRVFAGTDVFTGVDCDAGIDNHYWITVNATPAECAANDSCEDAVVVTDGTYDFDNSAATTDGSISCGGGANNVWYSYTAAADGLLNATTCNLTGLDTVLSAYDGCGGAELACNDDSCGLQSAVNVPMHAGDTVLISVAGFGGGRGSGQVAFRLDPPCILTAPSGAVMENEDCQSDTQTDQNGGCNNADGAVQTVSYNSAIWATASTFIDPGTGGQYRDTDWYEFDFAGGTLHVAGKAGFNLAVYILDTNCPPAILAATATTGPCQEASLDYDTGAGTYRVFAGLNGFTGLDCGGPTDNHYILTIGEPSTCPADFNGDGFLDFFDYDDYVGCFETGICPPGKTADFNGDGFADFFDYDDFVGAFEVGC